ncbi:DPY30 domain-containing protein 1-like [Erythrolamprus reginae]|uniref:DPY30 domain-containing protein 1-like n=1 Tax=Erythrolamprus reginae TaxID=121349 RepID=UPI00396CE6B4
MGTDAKYFKENLGKCLAEGLAAVADRRPTDPVRFLAFWIYSYNENRKNEEKKKSEKDLLELNYEELLAELESKEKLTAEKLLVAPKFQGKQDVYQEQTEDTPEKSMEIGRTSHQLLVADEEADEDIFEEQTEDTPEKLMEVEPLRGEVADEKTNEMTAEEKIGPVQEELEIKSLQEVLENREDPDELNVVINELDEQPRQVSPSLTLQEASLETPEDEGLSPKVLNDTSEDQLEQDVAAENDVQAEDDTQAEKDRSTQDGYLE